MVFALALFSNFLLAAAALARPTRQDLLTRRPGGRRDASQVLTLSAGASLLGHGDWTAVSATIKLPDARVPEGGSDEYAGAIWVGIGSDSRSCGSAIVQAGLTFFVDEFGGMAYYPFAGWYPNGVEASFSNITFNVGDNVTLTVTAENKTGTAIVENLTTGQKADQFLTSPDEICEKDAEFMVEFWKDNSTVAPIADFSTIKFSDAKASSPSIVDGLSYASTRNAYQGENPLTSVAVDSQSVTVQYIGSKL